MEDRKKRKNKFYITTAIDYPSAKPHMGHAYEKICADVIARWQRFKKQDVFFLTGTDEHGQKIEKYASKEGKSPQEFVDKMSAEFKKLCEKLNISYDDFIRTTEKRHCRVSQDIFQKVYDKGEIYKGAYEGLYCVECEAFYLERDLKEGKCPVHERRAEKVKEESYFFKMSGYQERILDHIQNNPDFIQPPRRRIEVTNRLKEGLRDLCVSRSSFRWGIPLPVDKTHIIFVWFDALINYISGLDYPKGKFKTYWPADIHLIGKDILWYHAVVWPAILLAAGIELPKEIFVHGFINVGGEKLSKAKGIVVDPFQFINKYGADALRYFLLREIPFGEDGNFSEEALVRRINSDLANDLGNLLHRTLTMVEKYFAGLVPGTDIKKGPDTVFGKRLKALPALVDARMNSFNFQEALAQIWELVNTANKFIEDSRPWELKKGNQTEKLAAIVYNLLDVIRIIAVTISAFMPGTAAAIWHQLGIDEDLSKAAFCDIENWGLIKQGTKVRKGEPLFPRIVE